MEKTILTALESQPEHFISLPLVSKNEESAGLPLVVNVVAKYWGEDIASQAAGKGAAALLLAKAPKGGGAAGRGARARGAEMVTSAEKAYANAMGGGSLTESMAAKMMDAGISGRNPAKLAEEAGQAAMAARTEASALSAARDAIPPAKATDASTFARGAQRKQLGVARDAAITEAEYQANFQKTAEAIPRGKTIKNILIEGMQPGHHAVVRPAITTPAGALSALNEIRKMPVWKTTLAIHKREFGKAIAAGDFETAASIGAGIASGALIADKFGHRDAIMSLESEVASAEKPELRRQMVALKRGVYVQPDGTEVLVPQPVMTRMLYAPRVNELESPIQAWLSDMAKQGRIRSGGRLEFR